MTRNDFAAALRGALMQLDDYNSLRSSPLLPLLCTPPYSPTPVGLQNRLLDAIQALRYTPGAHAQRYYEVLHFRYIEHLPQTDVAFQLGISERQLRREQMNALELLAEQIWQELAAAKPLDPAAVPAARTLRGEEQSLINTEMDWLRQQLAPGACDVAQALAKTLADVATLAANYLVRITQSCSETIGLAAVPPVALRQSALTVLTAIIPRLQQQELRITVERAATATEIRFDAAGMNQAFDDECAARIQIAHQILSPFGGQVERYAGPQAFVALRAPNVSSISVLVVDDNPDATELMQRFAQGSRFHIVCTNDARQTLQLACDKEVKAILIDIMMPQIDGWDLLAELRHHPVTQDIPVAVCSVLPQHELSRVLGAKMFIQKPLTQDLFLRALDLLTSAAVAAPC